MRLPWIRISVRRMMLAVAVVALFLWPLHHLSRMPYYGERARIHGMMASFCQDEAANMQRRADACMDRARRNAPWDDPADAARDLQCSPYLEDGPREETWLEQAMVWQRAARRSASAAQRHSRLYNYFRGYLSRGRVDLGDAFVLKRRVEICECVLGWCERVGRCGRGEGTPYPSPLPFAGEGAKI